MIYGIIELVFGDLTYNCGPIICQFFVIFTVLASQFTGLSHKNFGDYENIYDAYLRILANDKFKELSKKDYEESKMYLSLLNNLKTHIKKILDSPALPNYDSTEIQNIVEEQTRKDFDSLRFLEIISHIEKHMLTILSHYPRNRNQNKMWRMLSKYIRKPGINLYAAMCIVNLQIIVYVFVFYGYMQNTQGDNKGLFNLKEFDGNMVLILIFQIIVLVCERYIYLRNPSSWRKWEIFEEQKTEDTELLKFFEIKNPERLRPIQKFAKYARRIQIVLIFNPNLTGEELMKKNRRKA